MSEERDPKYTVAVCNYNMAETLEESLRSILDQLDERFEVLVVDDGSTDGSQEILDRLEEEYEILRWIEGNNDNIGEARAQANREARGEYILVQFDTDDKIQPIIKDLTKIYNKLEKNIDRNIFLSPIGPKELLVKTNYRSLGRGEDRDFWRRLVAENAMIDLEYSSFRKSLGYDYSKLDLLKNSYEETKNIIKSGVKPGSYIYWKIKNAKYKDDLFRALITPISYVHAKIEGIYTPPDGYERYGKYFEELERRTLEDLEKEYNFDLSDDLSKTGKKIFYSTKD